ncbi:MAG: amidohydrolase [Elusimicrobia bacterium]|nr:amidohydrolase [Elusimicrobiota bacterium]
MRSALAVLLAIFPASCAVPSGNGEQQPSGDGASQRAARRAGSADDPGLLIIHARTSGGLGEIWVRDRRIAAVGTGLRDRAPRARLIDAEGGWVLPGFHDAHLHLLDGGFSLKQADLSGARDMASAQASIERYAREHPRAPWILGRGWAYELAPPKSFPTRQDLDKAVSERPAALESCDGHTYWLNTRALKLAGIGPDTPDPAGGRIIREPGGQPSGILLEDAFELLDKALPAPSRAQRLLALERGLRLCLSLGLTSIQTMASDPGEYEDLAALLKKKRLLIRAAVSLPLEGDLDAYDALRRRSASPFLRLGHLKGFVDGVLETHTAFLLEPYPGSQKRGKPLIKPEKLKTLVARAQCRGFAVALHAIGDAAVRLSLDAFEDAARRCPPISARHRVEHAEVVSPDDLRRFKALGVAASMQPLHAEPAFPDPDVGAWPESLDPERRGRGFAWNSLASSGAVLAFGSDWPVVSANPLEGLAMAVSRKDRQGLPEGGWNSREALSAQEALRAYSYGPAYSLGLEKDFEGIVEGATADIVILEPGADPGKPQTLWNARIRRVLVDGEPVGPVPDP